MSDPIHTVERKEETHARLGQDLQDHRPRREARCEHGRLDVPAEGGRDQVEGAIEVEAAAEDAAGDAVERGAVPGDLGLVDAEMGGYGAVEALVGEDIVAGVFFRNSLGGDESASSSVWVIVLCWGFGGNLTSFGWC